jgi:hypothetical protein
MIIQTIGLDPSGSVWVDLEHPARNRKVVGSNPTSGSKTTGQSIYSRTLGLVLLVFMIILVAETGSYGGAEDDQGARQELVVIVLATATEAVGPDRHLRADAPASVIYALDSTR